MRLSSGNSKATSMNRPPSAVLVNVLLPEERLQRPLAIRQCLIADVPLDWSRGEATWRGVAVPAGVILHPISSGQSNTLRACI